jgi:hypothetical protein
MTQTPQIDHAFLEPLESALLSLEAGQIPLLIFAGSNSRRFVAQAAAGVGATVVYVSQADFDAQVRASLKQDDTLFVVIDRTLEGKSLDLIYGYLAARDIMGADNSKLEKLRIPPPSDMHRLALLNDKPVFDGHSDAIQRHLAEFCTVIGVG